MRSIIMAELIFLANGKCDLKFHANIKNFKRVEIVKHKKNFFKVYVDRNDSVYDVKRCEVITWKTIERGKRKVNVPDKVDEVRDVHLFDKTKGNPFKIAVTKIIGEIEAQRSGINKKSKRYKEISEKLRELKKPISELGEFFTSTSPLGLALWSSRFPNLILPPQQGGGHFVRFEKLDLYENKEG